MAKDKSALNKILDRERDDPLAAVLLAWRLWLLGALLGALLAFAVFSLSPPDFRSRATVVVDNNLEEAWTYFPDRQLFQFLRRETARLVEVAWSDSVMDLVLDQGAGLSVSDLRAGVLQLAQPSDGGWHFYANHADPAAAQSIASAWAQAFVSAARQAASAGPEMQAARASLDELLLNSPQPDEAALNALLTQITQLAESSQGISPYVEVYVSQAADLPLSTSVTLASYLFLGSLAGAFSAALFALLRLPRPQKKD